MFLFGFPLDYVSRKLFNVVLRQFITAHSWLTTHKTFKTFMRLHFNVLLNSIPKYINGNTKMQCGFRYGLPKSKYFTCVTKAIANWASYRRKAENFNGTIIFEFDIMKNSSPINLNLCQTWLFHLLFGCLFCFDLLWTELRVLWVQQKRSAILVLTWQKMWILNWVGMSFSWCQSQK